MCAAWEHTAQPWAAARGYLRGSCQCSQHQRSQPVNTEQQQGSSKPPEALIIRTSPVSPRGHEDRNKVHGQGLAHEMVFNKSNRLTIYAFGSMQYELAFDTYSKRWMKMLHICEHS